MEKNTKNEKSNFIIKQNGDIINLDLTEQLMRIANSLEKIEKKMPDINTIFTPNELRSLFGKERIENWPNEKSLSNELTIKELCDLELHEFNEMIKENNSKQNN